MGFTHNDAAVQGRQIKGMQRLTQLEHDVVGHIDNRINASDTGSSQPFDNRCRRRSSEVDISDHATDIPGAFVGCLYVDWKLRVVARRNRSDLSFTEFAVGNHRHIASNAEHAKAVGTIGGQPDLNDGVIQREIVAQVFAYGCVSGQLH